MSHVLTDQSLNNIFCLFRLWWPVYTWIHDLSTTVSLESKTAYGGVCKSLNFRSQIPSPLWSTHIPTQIKWVTVRKFWRMPSIFRGFMYVLLNFSFCDVPVLRTTDGCVCMCAFMRLVTTSDLSTLCLYVSGSILLTLTMNPVDLEGKGYVSSTERVLWSCFECLLKYQRFLLFMSFCKCVQKIKFFGFPVYLNH